MFFIAFNLNSGIEMDNSQLATLFLSWLFFVLVEIGRFFWIRLKNIDISLSTSLSRALFVPIHNMFYVLCATVINSVVSSDFQE